MTISSWNEVLSPWNESLIRISSFEELKDKIDPRVNIDELKQMFDFSKDWVIETSTSELDNLRKQFIQTGNLETIKSFLEKSKTSILEKSREWVQEVRDALRDSNHIEALKQKAWNIEAKDAEQWLEASIESLSNVTTKVWNSEAAKKAKEVATKAKEWWFWILSNLNWKSLEELPLIWWFIKGIISAFNIIKSFLNLDKAEKAKEAVEKALSPEEVEKTKTEIVQNISDNLINNKHINPILKEELEKIINNTDLISNDNLIKLKNILEKKGKLSFSDLKYIIWDDKLREIQEIIWTPKNKELLKAEAEKTLIDEIYKKYSLDIRKDKRVELEKLIKENVNVENYFDLQEQLVNWKKISVWDLLSAMTSQWLDFAILSIQMVAKWIIPTGKLLIYMWKKSTESISIWLASAWLWSEMSIDSFKKQIEWMSDVEKWLLMWTLYRQTWFLSTLLWNIASGSTRLIIDSLSNTTIKSSTAWWAAFTNNIDSQIVNFTKIENMFWKSAWSELIKNSLSEIKKLKTNNEIIRILNESNNNAEQFKKLLNKLDSKSLDLNIINSIKNLDIKDFLELRKAISRWIIIQTTWFSEKLSKSLNNLWFAKAKYEFKLYESTNKILAFQKEAIRWWKLGWLWKFMNYFSNISWHMDLSRSLDSLHFENLSKAKALNKMQAISKMFQEFPILAKSVFWAVPEIAFFWLAINWKKEDESWLKAMIDTWSYMLPIVWPIRMTLSASWALENWEAKWYDVAEWWVWVTLGIIDTLYITKIIATGWNQKTIKILWYIAKPITSSYALIRDSIKTWINIKDTIKAEWKINWSKLWEWALNKIKKAPKSLKWIILGIVLAGWYIWYELLKDDIWDEYKNLLDKWIINNKWEIIDNNKLKEKYKTMSIEDKKSIIELIFMLSKVSTSNLEFNLDSNNNLTVISHSKEIRTNWILTDDRTNILELLDLIWIKPLSIKFIPGKVY